MKYFRITYRWKTRPMFRKGREKTRDETFAAVSQTEAYGLARDWGTKRFSRHRWSIVNCEEIKVGGA